MGRKPLRQDQREFVLATAIALIDQEGFHNLSFQKIADKAKLSQSAVMHYFPKKAALFTAISDYIAVHNVTFVQSQHSHKDGALIALQKFIHGNILWAEKHPDLARLLVLFSTLAIQDDEAKANYNQRLQSVRQKLEAYIYAGIREKVIHVPESEAEHWAALVHNMVVSGIINFLASGAAKEKKNYLKRSELILRSLTSPPPLAP